MAVLEHLKAHGPALQTALDERTSAMVSRLNGFARAARRQKPDRASAAACSTSTPRRKTASASLLFYLLRARGIHAQDNFPLFLTTAHTEADVQAVAEAFEAAVTELQSVGILTPAAKAHQRVTPKR